MRNIDLLTSLSGFPQIIEVVPPGVASSRTQYADGRSSFYKPLMWLRIILCAGGAAWMCFVVGYCLTKLQEDDIYVTESQFAPRVLQAEYELQQYDPTVNNDELQAALDEDLHFHPGLAAGDAHMYDHLAATFLSSPVWAEEEIYNEEGYEAYYVIRGIENMRLSEVDIQAVLAELEEKKEKQLKKEAELEKLKVEEAKNEAEEAENEDEEPEEEAEEAEEADSRTTASGYTAEQEEALRKAMKKKLIPEGIRVMCYSVAADQIIKRCQKALNWGDSVLIQMNDHHNNMLPYGDEWYEALKRLQNEFKLDVVGVFFGAPQWDQLEEILERYGDSFHGGVQINVENEKGGCINNLADLNVGKLKNIIYDKSDRTIDYDKIRISYLVKGEDPSICVTSKGINSEWDVHANVPLRDLVSPVPGLELEFPCFNGHEGRCFRAFNEHRTAACDSNRQRYVFAPYDRISNRMLHLYNEACLGNGRNLPSHDVVQAI